MNYIIVIETQRNNKIFIRMLLRWYLRLPDIMEFHGNSEISKFFGSVAEKLDFAQLTLFRWKSSKTGQKWIKTIKNTTFLFDYSTIFFCPFGKKITKNQGGPKAYFKYCGLSYMNPWIKPWLEGSSISTWHGPVIAYIVV